VSVYPTKHLNLQRWPQRGDPAQHPSQVWDRAEPLDMSLAENGMERVPNHDEARYDEQTQTVLFRDEDRLVTCYSVVESAITNDHGRAVRQAVEAQFGLADESSDNRFTEGDS